MDTSLPQIDHMQGKISGSIALRNPTVEPTIGRSRPFRGELRDAVLFMPKGFVEPGPLLVLFHGATSNPDRVLEAFIGAAEATGVAIVAPKSKGYTWDGVTGSFSVDVAQIDELLYETGRHVDVDRTRLGIGGFSDGASYALTLGVTNGEIFQKILAFSPGFMAPGPRSGKPFSFIAHGVYDEVLPIDRCSRRIVPGLLTRGYSVDYREFYGAHVTDPDLVLRGMQTLAFSAKSVN